jgi:hypothetical protein
MPELVTPAVILPRFTTFVHPVGTFIFHTLPVEVAAYESAALTGWRGALMGTTPTFGFAFEESTDRLEWFDCVGTSGFDDPGANSQHLYEFTFSRRWFRMAVQLGGTNAGASCWVQGHFVNRRP